MPYDTREDDSPKFAPTYDEQDFLAAVRDQDVAGTKEIADVIGCTVDAARYRLDKLAEDGAIGKKEIGGKNVYLSLE